MGSEPRALDPDWYFRSLREWIINSYVPNGRFVYRKPNRNGLQYLASCTSTLPQQDQDEEGRIPIRPPPSSKPGAITIAAMDKMMGLLPDKKNALEGVPILVFVNFG